MGEQKRKKRHLWHRTPYDGVPGAYAAVQRFLYQFEGPAQLGDPNEPPYVPPADPKCPVCGQSVKRHGFDRGGPGKPTRMQCPPPEQAGPDAAHSEQTHPEQTHREEPDSEGTGPEAHRGDSA